MSPGDAIERLEAAIDEVAAIDPAALVTAGAFGELLEQITRCARRLDHEFHRLLHSFDLRGDCKPLGYRTTGQWCRDRLRASSSAAGASLRLGRMLIEMPTVSKHWAAGEVGAEHAAIIASARTDETRDAFADSEPWLADRALELELRGLKVAITRWKLRADPDSDEPERRERDRDAHVSETFQGAVVIDAALDAVRGAAFKTVFDRLVDELFRADWAEAKERLGRDPAVHELTRTHAQRRADALVEMAVRAEMCTTPTARRPRPLVTVVTGLDSLADGLAELWNQTPITARQLARILAEDPDIERYVYGAGQQPIAYNERSRLYTGKLRRAIQVRDRHCTARGCDLPAERCDIDHIDPAANGGRTTPTNGRVACSSDNRARPHRRFRNDPDP